MRQLRAVVGVTGGRGVSTNVGNLGGLFSSPVIALRPGDDTSRLGPTHTWGFWCRAQC
jgi:hypothetical protein